MRPLNQTFWAVIVVGASLALALPHSTAAGGRQDERVQAAKLTESARFERSGLTLRFPRGWVVGESRFANADVLWQMPAGGGRAARIMITTEPRTDHADAVRRLGQIAAETPSRALFLEIGGWPALQRRHLIPRPLPGREDSAPENDGNILRITTAVAAGSILVRLEASIPAERALELARQVEAIGRSARFGSRGEPEQVEQDLSRLRLETPPAPPLEPEGATLLLETTGVQAAEDVGAPVRAQAGGSEISVAVSNNGQNVVVATNSGYTVSSNGGDTFSALRFPAFPGTYFRVNGDPSLAVGRSGNFYYALIGFPAGNPGPPPAATQNATALSVSTDNGQNFTFRSNAVLCQGGGVPPAPAPGACFADQEHIAADRFNAGSGGGDQVYSTWRNFDGADQDPALVCSQDSANNWSAPLNVGTGVKPRINVGQDGFVYVIYLNGNNVELRRYTSCANGLTLQAGFPQVVATIAEVTCPVPGLDRCTGRNTLASYTVAVDDTNANHVYAAFATNTANNVNENVLVRDSTDGGVTWPPARVAQLNAAVNARRFMPWMCTIGGTAHVTWYDRRFATAQNNDLTDFFRGSAALGGGGNLVAGPEVQLTQTPDPHCASGWPCATDRISDSEGCSLQPQPGGVCTGTSTAANPRGVACDFSDCDSCTGGGTCAVAGTACGTNADCPRTATCACTLAQSCVVGVGCPKYGDYNYSACAAGRIYSAWASATSPPSLPPNPANRIDAFMNVELVCCVPRVEAPANLALPATCAGDTGTAPLNVCNTGFTNLNVTGVASSDPQFSVTTALPVVIPAGNCQDLTARFAPGSRGPKAATLTLSSNDPVKPNVGVAVSGLGKGIESIACPADVTTGNDPGLCSAVVNPGAPTAQADGCPVGVGGVRSDGQPLGDPYPVGATTITWTATDGGGNSLSCPHTITVNDVEPPVISVPAAVPNELWPPNHKMVQVTVNYTVSDNCDAPGAITCGLGVTSNEPINGTGDGDTEPDWDVIDPHHVLLRAERSGNGHGRVYTVTVICDDTKSNASSKAVAVSVPKSRGR